MSSARLLYYIFEQSVKIRWYFVWKDMEIIKNCTCGLELLIGYNLKKTTNVIQAMEQSCASQMVIL